MALSKVLWYWTKRTRKSMRDEDRGLFWGDKLALNQTQNTHLNADHRNL